MYKTLLTISLALLLSSASAQKFSSELWHDGYLVSTDQDTLNGSIKYDMETNIVQVLQGNIVKTFSSHKLFYFEIYDQLLENYRQFYSIPYNVNYNYEIPILFEVLYEGPLSLLAREEIVQETVNNSSAYWAASTYIRDVVSYTFFFLDKEGNIDLFTGKRNDLLQIMRKHQSEVKNFVKKNRLKTDEVPDLIRITAFYNSL